MKKIFLIGLIVLFAAIPAIAKVNLPKAKEFRLDNGLTVKVVERHTLPLFSLQMSFKAGSICDPQDKEGLAFLCNEMLMRGTKNRSARHIVEAIAFVGGTLSNYCDREETGFAGEFLTDNGERSFEVMADLLLNSTFSQEELEKTANLVIAGLKGELERPGAVATNNIYSAILGDNPFAHQVNGSVESIGSITRDDIVGFFSDYYTPDNCLLVICGDIDKKQAELWVKKYFRGWNGKTQKRPAVAEFEATSGTDILILDKVDATQTQIRIGNTGLSLKHPDYVPFEAARTILAGSFTSRLVNEIRVNRGLSYGVSCRSPRYIPGGIVYISTFTKNESVGEVLDIILSETKRMTTEAVPDSELVGAQNYRSGLYPLNFETNDDIAEVFSNMWLYDLDKSHYEDFQEKVKDVSGADLMKAAGKYFPLENYRIVLVGKAEEIKDQAAKYGTVTVQPLATE
ncbi:MAG: insulinase family protein [FCB group bacterium]|nr:insulinase family protein [FCB group bacterium]